MIKFKRTTTNILASIIILAVLPLAAHAEWRRDNNGWWYSKGAAYALNWANIDGKWYYFDTNGYMKTGWVKDNGNWYYFNEDGTMLHDITIDGYYLNSDGTISSDKTSLSAGTLSCH